MTNHLPPPVLSDRSEIARLKVGMRRWVAATFAAFSVLAAAVTLAFVVVEIQRRDREHDACEQTVVERGETRELFGAMFDQFPGQTTDILRDVLDDLRPPLDLEDCT